MPNIKRGEENRVQIPRNYQAFTGEADTAMLHCLRKKFGNE
ncbi:MAG: hypothetical protein AB1589_05900 [Cyanobacteriota bacterium]